MQLFNSKKPAYQSTEAIFRSAPMTLVQFYVTMELARDLVFTLGNLGQVHFRDLNAKLTAFQRTFITELRNIDVVELNLTFLFSMMAKYSTFKGDPFANLVADENPLPTASEMEEIKERVAAFHDKIKHLDDSHSALELKKYKYLENRHVINSVHNFHKSSLVPSNQDADDEFRQFEIEDDDEEALLNEGRNSDSFEIDRNSIHETSTNLDGNSLFNSICGVVARDKIPILRKILWRTLRGNLYFNDIPIDELLPESLERQSELVHKSVFIIYIHGEYLRERVRRIINSLDGHIYDNTGGGAGGRLATLNELNGKIEDLNNVVESTRSHLITELLVFQEKYPDWYYVVKRERSIFEELNKFDEDSTRRCLVGEGWIPRSEVENIRRALKNLVRAKTASANNPLVSNSEISLSNDTLNNQGASAPPLFAVGNEDQHGNEEDSDDDNDNDDQDFNFVAVLNELATTRTPPTYHKTNKFTSGFQSIVDTYGISSYQEVNPGLATIVTFPFMFAIMFGDLGHGFIVLLISLYFVKNERHFDSMRKMDEILGMAYSGRYIMLLMGFFSIFTGLLYNDIFSKSMTIFNSTWKWEFPEDFEPSLNSSVPLVATRKGSSVYPIGLDWAWHGAENGLLFTNSYKMKMSVLMGYIHMTYSYFFSLVNYRFFNSRVDIIGNFIPGLIFMQSIFGYLSLTIVYKWCVDWFGTNRQPPGLLNMLINMFLAPGSIEDPLYKGQAVVQVILVLLALCCVPWLLVYKPMILRRENLKAKDAGYSDIHSQRHHALQLQEEEEALVPNGEVNSETVGLHPDDEVDLLNEAFHFPNDIEPMVGNSGHGGEGEEFNFMDIVIHQVIHTIEFCLNCVSHTASYLRLWALSLAHAQLSSVLWTMTIQNAFGATGTAGIIMTFFLFAMWFTLTLCILVMMEGTSAMLHSLRLHWVEAMSKFFEGEGYLFEPYSFKNIEL
ncbi:hypothetical protein CA3LBN_000121 [Candidozyma haemuli]|uniref:V-type proton ATPase subunit a n=2 Tax=Candidozyma TaxID=3303203 RepID=A0ABX8I426_9ASCO|nr:hypothetical protein CA3LBN_000121 [[Candida] haemuloni]